MLAVGLALAAMLPPAALAEGYARADSAGFSPVEVTIRNDSAVMLRCVVILAHFITRPAGPIGAGASLPLALERDAAGALGYGSHNGEPMLVENILCGSDDAWDATRGEIPLTLVRAGGATAYIAACGVVGRVACAVEQR